MAFPQSESSSESTSSQAAVPFPQLALLTPPADFAPFGIGSTSSTHPRPRFQPQPNPGLTQAPKLSSCFSPLVHQLCANSDILLHRERYRSRLIALPAEAPSSFRLRPPYKTTLSPFTLSHLVYLTWQLESLITSHLLSQWYLLVSLRVRCRAPRHQSFFPRIMPGALFPHSRPHLLPNGH